MTPSDPTFSSWCLFLATVVIVFLLATYAYLKYRKSSKPNAPLEIDPDATHEAGDNIASTSLVSDDPVDESIPEEFRYNVVFNKKVSELRAMFEEQHRLIREEGAEKPKRNVAYQAVICDEQLNHIPLDARSLGLLVQGDELDPSMLSENFEFSLILAMGSSSPGTIDVPFDTSVDTREILYQAESAGFGVNLLPPANATVINAEVEAYCDLLRDYGRICLEGQSCNIRVSPIDGYMEYLLYAELGYKPKVISTDEMMNMLYTDTMSEVVMDHVKACIEEVVIEVLGPDFMKDLVLNTVKALHLKDLQFMEARASILEAELDTRTPFPNMIRILAETTGLRGADAAGLLFELKNAIHTVLDKYLPPDPVEDAEPKTVVTSDSGAETASTDGVQQVDPEAKVPAEDSAKRVRAPNTKQADLAKALCLMASSVAGGPEALKAVWASIETATQLDQRINLDRETTLPSLAAGRLADALGVAPKVAALAAGELATLVQVVLEAGGAIEPAPPPAPPKPNPPSGLIAVG